MAEYSLPAVGSVAFANLLMAGVFAVLYLRERRAGLKLFALAWTLEAVRHLFSLSEVNVLTFFGGGITFALAVLTLVEGSFRFAGRKPSVIIRVLVVTLVAWQVVVYVWQPPFVVWHLPVSLFIAAMRLVVAAMLWTAGGPWLGRGVATFAMALWGVHALTYPFLANVESAAPWGFAISASLGLLTAMGVVMAYFERARQEADASEAGLRSIFDGASDGIATLDRDGRVLTANPALAKLLGFDDPRELEEAHLASLVGRDRGEFTQPPSGAIESWNLRDGERRVVSTRVSGTRSGDRVDVFVRDVTEQTRSELALEETRRLEALGRLAGGVAHDFNNLLQVISASVEITSRSVVPERREHLEIALGASARGAELTRQLLTFGRGQSAAPRHVDLGRVARELADWVTRLLGDQVTLDLEIPNRPIVVRADRGQLEQVLVNLLTNGRDAMPEGGRVRVRVREEGERVAMEVQDEGIGMDEQTRSRIFEPFFTTKEHGTGLGLATVHGIAAQHGWELQVRSRPGEGTTFEVVFPLAHAEAESVEQPLDEPIPASCARVLLVDDDATLRMLFAELLTDAGYQARALGPHELDRAALEACDVLVTDVRMPGTSGPELARRARLLSPQVGVVFVSGDSGDDLGSLDGRTAFVPKPFRGHELIAAVERVLSK